MRRELGIKALRDAHMDRHSFVLTMGGGALLDLTDYATAITHRGLRTVRLPSTVLAQNDSSRCRLMGASRFCVDSMNSESTLAEI